jgi:hypothetical protein
MVDEVVVVVVPVHPVVAMLIQQMVRQRMLVTVAMATQTTFLERNTFGQAAAVVGTLDIRQIFMEQVTAG